MPACRHKRAAGGRPRPCGLWRPSRSPLGAHEHGGPLAARRTAHGTSAVDGRRPGGAEGREDALALVTAAAASIRRTTEPPQSGIGRRRRGPAFVLPPRPAVAPVGVLRSVPPAAPH